VALRRVSWFRVVFSATTRGGPATGRGPRVVSSASSLPAEYQVPRELLCVDARSVAVNFHRLAPMNSRTVRRERWEFSSGYNKDAQGCFGAALDGANICRAREALRMGGPHPLIRRGGARPAGDGTPHAQCELYALRAASSIRRASSMDVRTIVCMSGGSI
jgi:hypothetical protein